MNKQELIDNAVEYFRGKWGDARYASDRLVYTPDCDFLFHIWDANWANNGNWTELCTKDEFVKRARELGWCNGYKYGVEYPTNGEKPELPRNVIVDVKINDDWKGAGVASDAVWTWNWDNVNSFRIVDKRYKPVDAELVVNQQFTAEQPKKDISDSSFALSDAVSALIDAGLNDEAKQVQAINKLLLEMHATRKAEAEKKRVVGAAVKHLQKFGLEMTAFVNDCVSELYDIGALNKDFGKEQSK